MVGEERRTLRDFIIPRVQWNASSIAQPAVDANNFELKPALISMVQQSLFSESPLEDPNLHLLVFLEVCDTLKLNGVSNDAIRLHFFPFSLRDKARDCLRSLPSSCITTWDELTRALLTKFFPPSKTASLRNQITNFLQKEDVTLYEAWEHFKNLLCLYPHHGLQHWTITQAFYNDEAKGVRSTIDLAAGGTLMSKTEDEAYNLLRR